MKIVFHRLKDAARAALSLALAAFLVACSGPNTFMIDGQWHHLSDMELAKLRQIWRPGAMEVASSSRAATYDHQWILDLIAHRESVEHKWHVLDRSPGRLGLEVVFASPDKSRWRPLPG